MSKKLALTVGINTYPAAPLSGCVNDANDWATLLQSQGYYVGTLLNEHATKETIVEALRNRIAELHWGDRLVFTYSGHGSWIPDLSGDEPDGRDEVLCPYDYAAGNVIVDDELAGILAQRRRGVRVTVFSDSCHSGSVSRLASLARGRVEVRPRFVSPLTFLPPGSPAYQEARTISTVTPVTMPRSSTGTVLFAGCDDTEYSYDAFIDGWPRGAFSWAALSSWRPGISYRGWQAQITKLLPSQTYPQSPQLYASLWQRRWTL